MKKSTMKQHFSTLYSTLLKFR